MLNIINKLNGYKYWRIWWFGQFILFLWFNPREINSLKMNEYKFKYDYNKKKYLLSSVNNKLSLVPILALSLKELNHKIQKNIERINELQDLMFKKDQEKKKKFAQNKVG